ncbi:MAG TPA: DUF255 domain-containing protein [Armatimonadota bacterium]|nr:DUF255 domain-containing protein [Armatimonadota bacterium]
MARSGSSQIKWREWSDEAFEQAEREDKLILLDISASWCHWCHVMDRSTYSNPQVIEMVSEKFVPIRVDADKRPDIQYRYLLGGWPTTAFLLPDGRILTGTTFIPSEAMVNKLREVDMLYHEQKSIVAMHVTSMAAEAEYERTEAEFAAGKLDGQVVESVAAAVKQAFDPVYGGFGAEPKFPYPDALRLAFVQHRKTGDRDMLEIARKTLDGMMGIYDEIWGGSYRYSVSTDWTQPHYEKMLYVQAGVLDNYVEAYHVTGDDRYGEVAAGIEAYVTRFLSDQERGGLYGSQDADIGGNDPNADLVPGEEYFPKGEDERLAIGVPYVDKTIYTDCNGMMASAYFRLYHVTGDRHARDFALKTIDRILSESMRDGRMCHYTDDQARLFGLLSDQVYFAQALVDAYQTSGHRTYLAKAEELVGFMAAELQDVVDGGFYFETFDPGARGGLLERHKPFDENVAAVRLLTQLHYLTGCYTYRGLAERTLKAGAYPKIAESIIGAGYALALDLFMSSPVRIVVVGRRDDKETQEMLETSLHTYEPQKLVQVLDPAEDPLTIGELTYEAAEKPVAYVCVRNVCREPVKGSEELAVVLENVIGRAPS